MRFKVISYYCDVDDTQYYEKSYHRLKKQLDYYQYNYEIDHLESLGSYKENCRRKAQFILDKLDHCDDDLLWLDIDTILLKRMETLDLLKDNVELGFASTIPIISSIKASPVFIKNNNNTRRFLKRWVSLIDITRKRGPECFDHEVLYQASSDASEYCEIFFLGIDYCVWPGRENDNTVILMGLSDVESKKTSLYKMGMKLYEIENQSVGLYFE